MIEGVYLPCIYKVDGDLENEKKDKREGEELSIYT